MDAKPLEKWFSTERLPDKKAESPRPWYLKLGSRLLSIRNPWLPPKRLSRLVDQKLGHNTITSGPVD